jgi:hypothetical protein
MKVRKRYVLVPLLALLGVLLALWLSRTPRMDTSLLPLAPTPGPHEPAPAPAAEPEKPAVELLRSAVSEKKLKTPREANEAAQLQSEMKIALSALWGAEKSFFSEYHRYSTDFNQIGYVPDEGRLLHAKVGFLRPFNPSHPNPNERPDNMSTESLHEANPDAYSFSPEASEVTLADAARYCHEGCTASDTGFELVVVSKLNGRLDVWTLNDRKVMIHETMGND